MAQIRVLGFVIVTLASKLKLKLYILTIGLIVMSVVILWTLSALRKLADSASEEFAELQLVHLVHRHLDEAVTHIGRTEYSQALEQLVQSRHHLESFINEQTVDDTVLPPEHSVMELRAVREVQEIVDAAIATLSAVYDRDTAKTADINRVVEDIGVAMTSVVWLSNELEQTVVAIEQPIVQRLRLAAAVLGVFFLVVIIVSVVANIRHYHSIIRPLRYIQDGARRLAEGNMSVRLTAPAEVEFEQLQYDFNHMADELQSLYEDLERRVESKSKELVLAERRAGVGYLAAGVAHEVNNPLGIISGHAESLLRRLRNGRSQTGVADIVQDLAIIRDEAFRCKKITQDLMELSQMGDEHRDRVDLRQLIEDAVTLAAASPAAKNRQLDIRIAETDTLPVLGRALELKQVLLNLIINALQSVREGHGQVVVSAQSDEQWVTLQVTDNGCGIAAEDIDHVFEPFYTSGKGHMGIGLGLSISQAIVQHHGGSISAKSAGPGQGTTFTVRLPVASERVPDGTIA